MVDTDQRSCYKQTSDVVTPTISNVSCVFLWLVPCLLSLGLKP